MAYGNPGDMIIGITTSGNAENVCLAMRTAKMKGMTCVGLTGKGGGKLKALSDILIEAPETETAETDKPETEAAATETPVTETTETAAEATETLGTETTETAAPATEAPAAETAQTKETETEAPTTETPETEPAATGAPSATAEIVEEVSLDEGAFEEIEGSVVLGDSGSALEWVEMEDGVPVAKRPRLEERNGRVRVSLEGLIHSVDGWRLTRAGNTIVIEAAGYVVGLYNEDSGLAATVDGLEVEIDPEDFVFDREGDFIDANFLARCLGGEAEWDAEERTLMLRIPGKEVANASD